MRSREKKAKCFCKVVGGPLTDDLGRPVWVVLVAKGGPGKLYWVFRQPPTPMGQAFQVEALAPGRRDAYQALVGAGGEPDRCTCLGHLHRGRCKHVAALRALLGRGKL